MDKKIKKIVNYLKDEINFIKKFGDNYKKNYINYNYINNFNNIHNYLEKINKDESIILWNKYIYLFNKEKNFFKKSEYLMNVLKNAEEVKEIKENEDFSIFSSYNNDLSGYYFLTFINKYYLLSYNKKSNNICLMYYFNDNYEISSEIKINNTNNYETINFTSISSFYNKIYICLNSKIMIFNYNLSKKKNTIDKIGEISLKYCYICVEIKKDYLLGYNRNQFVLYNNMIFKKRLNYKYELNNIISINNEYFIGTNIKNNIIIFYDINTLKEIKRLNILVSDNIGKFKEKFIINIPKLEIYLIYIKTKEIVQRIQIFDIYIVHFYLYIYE